MNKQKEISFADVSRELDSGIAGADMLRADQLEQLIVARQAKDTGLKREQARLTKKLGADHPRVAAIAGRLKVNAGMQRDLTLESTRARTEIPKVDEKSWAVHGYVRGKDLKGVPDLSVALYDDRGQWIRQLGYACTDKNGYFKLLHGSAEPPAADVEAARAESRVADVAAASAAAAPRTAPGERAFYLHVTNSQRATLYVDKQPLTPEPGRLDYREIVLGEDAGLCGSPESAPGPQPGKDEGKERSRYLGNSGTRELHDLERTTPRCQIGEIRPVHRVSFRTEQEALAAGYDRCAYCFGKGKSKRRRRR